uniref:cytokinin dehydrogenase n=1 Tax=Fagus sylvatica TaxID=28930 RepID=A0A2N9IR79_FAGSY
MAMICIVTFVMSNTLAITFVPPKDIADRFRNDSETINLASTDYGHIVHEIPSSVFYPNSLDDIATLVKFAYNNFVPITIAARGQGHSVRGQSMAHDGVVVNMTSLANRLNGSGIIVSSNPSLGSYADVGGEQLWIDVLSATLEHGLTPVSWIDYLYLTVGGTLSNAGISGQTFRFGPQISNVNEMDVITGKGDFVTCSTEENSELYYAVLGGLGQFGIITRARIALQPAPKRVKWLRILYSDFSAFARDQENLISINERKETRALDYIEGMLLLDQGSLDLSFYPQSDYSRITSLVTKNGIIYCLEVAKYYDDSTESKVDKELQLLLKGLGFLRDFMYEKDVAYIDFLNRVRKEELFLRSKGLWDVPHPWLNLFVPKSRILDFNSGIFKGMILKQNISAGLVLIYPMNRNKWDDNMSMVIPDEDVFYVVSMLRSSGFNNWEAFDNQNKEMLQFCDNAGIEVKPYLAHYETQENWINHFGSKWESFKERKAQFDPKMILSPGQRIFNNN